jgi:hypothetical protein
MSDLVERLRDTGLHSAAQAADALEALASRIAELEDWKAAEDAHHHMLLSRIAALEASGYTISQGWQDIAASPRDGRGE